MMTTASKKIGRFREPFLANKRALGKQSMPEDVGYIEDDLETTSGCSCMLDTGASPNAVPVGSSVNGLINHHNDKPASSPRRPCSATTGPRIIVKRSRSNSIDASS